MSVQEPGTKHIYWQVEARFINPQTNYSEWFHVFSNGHSTQHTTPRLTKDEAVELLNRYLAAIDDPFVYHEYVDVIEVRLVKCVTTSTVELVKQVR